MKIFNKINTSSDGGPRRFAIELTTAKIVSVGIVMVLGISWVFILGILVGRGYRPEEAVPELAQIMPATESPATLESATPPTVLKPEELQFMEDLQGQGKNAETITVDSTQKAPKPSPALPGGAAPSGGLVGRDLPDAPAPQKTAPGASSQPRPAPAPAPAPAARAPADPMAQPPVQPPKTVEQVRVEPVQTAAPKAEAKPAGAEFEATYQVASFYKKDQAEALIKKLTQKGFRAEIRQARIKDKDVYRIAVTLRGTEREISAGLEKTGEKGPILLGKKPL